MKKLTLALACGIAITAITAAVPRRDQFGNAEWGFPFVFCYRPAQLDDTSFPDLASDHGMLADILAWGTAVAVASTLFRRGRVLMIPWHASKTSSGHP